jgi:UDP-2,4-diacetamido-2,4,6-trideoxy-beta-L-altropyranose hydrolase
MGTGHVMRCLALAQEWIRRGGEVICVTAPGAPALIKRMEAENIRVIGLGAEVGGAADAAMTTSLAQTNEADWVILDGYHFDADYQLAVKEQGLRLLCVDDAGALEHYWADVVLNQNFGANVSQYPRHENYTRFCLGPQYTLLRSEFLEWRYQKRVVPTRGHNVLVTFGGSDPENLTARVVYALKDRQDDALNVTVVIGASNPNYNDVLTLAETARTPMRLETNVQDMSGLMAESDIAVILAGGTLAETLFMGCAVISYAHSEEQARVLRALDAQGVIACLGPDTAFDGAELLRQIVVFADSVELRETLARQGRELIDGGGVERVVQVLG